MVIIGVCQCQCQHGCHQSCTDEINVCDSDVCDSVVFLGGHRTPMTKTLHIHVGPCCLETTHVGNM